MPLGKVKSSCKSLQEETCKLKSLDCSVKLFKSNHILNVTIHCFFLDIENNIHVCVRQFMFKIYVCVRQVSSRTKGPITNGQLVTNKPLGYSLTMPLVFRLQSSHPCTIELPFGSVQKKTEQEDKR